MEIRLSISPQFTHRLLNELGIRILILVEAMQFLQDKNGFWKVKSSLLFLMDLKIAFKVHLVPMNVFNSLFLLPFYF